MTKKDYYEVLGLTSQAQPLDIKRKYRILALKWHPDKHNNKKEAGSKFSEINEAYSVLNNPRQKAIYDKYGHVGIERLHQGHATSIDPKTSALDILLNFMQDKDEDHSPKQQKETHANLKLHRMRQTKNSNTQNTRQPNKDSEFTKAYKPTFMDPQFMTSFDDLLQAEKAQSAQQQEFLSRAPAAPYSFNFGMTYTAPNYIDLTDEQVQHHLFMKLNNPSIFTNQYSQQNRLFGANFNSGEMNSKLFSQTIPLTPTYINLEEDEEENSIKPEIQEEAFPTLLDSSFMSDLKEFDESLNNFHERITFAVDNEKLQPQSKKIQKMEKDMTGSWFHVSQTRRPPYTNFTCFS